MLEIKPEKMVDKIRLQAESEIREEFEKKAKDRVKIKLRELELAKKVVDNLTREIEDLYVELSQ